MPKKKPQNNEQKNASFRRLAVERTQKVLEEIESLSMLANKYLYVYHDWELAHMFSSIDLGVVKLRSCFALGKSGSVFDLPDLADIEQEVSGSQPTIQCDLGLSEVADEV